MVVPLSFSESYPDKPYKGSYCCFFEQAEFKRCHDAMLVISDSWKALKGLGIHGGIRHKLKSTLAVSLTR